MALLWVQILFYRLRSWKAKISKASRCKVSICILGYIARTAKRTFEAVTSISKYEEIDKVAVPSKVKRFANQRSLEKYIEANCRPDICLNVQRIAAEIQRKAKEKVNHLCKGIAQFLETSELRLDFVPIEIATLRIIAISDASFANAS